MKHLRTSILLVLVFIVLTGLAFPFAILGIGQAVFPYQANGSMITDKNGKIIGSELIAQAFSKPEYFHPRPSNAGSGYDPTASGGTNLGPTSDKLINGIHKKTPDGKDDPSNFDGIKDLAAAYRAENGLAVDEPVPGDAVTRSSSGLDPEITVENANIQAIRVSKVRGLAIEKVRQLIAENTAGRFAGLYGEPAVNVLRLNLALNSAVSGKR